MVTMGTAATPMKTEKQQEISQTLKCKSKRRKTLCAQSRNQLHCNSLGAEKKLEIRMSVRHIETGQESWCKFQIVKFMLWGMSYQGVQERTAYSEFISGHALLEQLQSFKGSSRDSNGSWQDERRGATHEERLKELNISRLVKKVLCYRRQLYAVFQNNTPDVEKKLLGSCKWNWLATDKT